MLMMTNINQDLESQRIKRNMTQTQKKVANSVKEGVLVNSNRPLTDTCNSLLIADSVELPNKLYEKNTNKEKSILPITAGTVGFMSVLTGVTALIAKSSKDAVDVDLAKKLPSMTRNVCVNKEMDQAIYRLVANPNKKTAMAAAGLAVFSSMAFMAKNFCEGFRDVWVKKKEADIQKNLQENLISVETQSFSGKMQIIRSMLSDKAKEFSNVLSPEKPQKNNNFSSKISFTSGGDKSSKNDKTRSVLSNVGYAMIGAAATTAIIGLGYLSMKNLRSSNESMKRGINKVKDAITEIAENTKNHNMQELGEEGYNQAQHLDREKISNLFVDISADNNFVRETAERMKWGNDKEKEDFVTQNIFNINKSTERANSALGGSGQDRNTFYSHVSDYKAFLYNWLIDSNNKQFKNLFFGITGATATAYLGQLTIGAAKDVQVKKYNAETELNLQQNLVSTELRNFKSKKDSSIDPLCDEFYRQKKSGKSNEELKVLAENILFEIKNGAPYVYS